MFRDWIFRNFQLAPRDNAVTVQLMTEMDDYCDAAARATDSPNPQDDMRHAGRQRRDRRRAGRSDELKLGYIRC